MQESKQCNVCLQTLPASEFYRHNKKTDQLRPKCKVCHNLAVKDYVQSNSVRRNAYQRKWHIKNPDKRKAYTEAFKERHPDASKRYQTKYTANNPEIIRNKSARKRTRRRRNGEFSITKRELKKLYASPCFYCGNPSQHLDHVVPISRGGVHSIGNLVPACASCNLQKSDRFITEWQKAIRERERKRSS